MISNKIITKEFLMELVYLWVEDYKNIQKQGFNFSPNFECEFIPVYENDKLSEKSELKITPKENPLKDFFCKDINVTAIVGENGSGKSRILEVLLSILINNEKINSYLIIVKNHNGDLIQYDSLNVNTNDVNKEIKEIKKNYNGRILEDYKCIDLLFITNEYIEETFFEKIKYESEQSNTIRTYAEKKNINIKILENARKFTNVKFIKDAKNFFLPTKVKIKIDDIKGINRLKEDKQKQIENLKELDDNKSFESLSYGERQLLSLLHLVLNHFNSKKTNTFDHSTWNEQTAQKDEAQEDIYIKKYLLLIDEFELGLHPNWQKKALTYMIDFLKLFAEKIDLIITSHSPFLLSDLPKENIMFLEKGKQVYPFEDEKQTFGANIHTLLSHGFFMKDGLMGEFAKSKIDDVINYLNNKESEIKNDEDAQNIIDIIGEPIIKRELQRMLKNKMELSNKTEIDTIKDEIKLLTKRLEDLEKDDK